MLRSCFLNLISGIKKLSERLQVREQDTQIPGAIRMVCNTVLQVMGNLRFNRHSSPGQKRSSLEKRSAIDTMQIQWICKTSRAQSFGGVFQKILWTGSGGVYCKTQARIQESRTGQALVYYEGNREHQ